MSVAVNGSSAPWSMESDPKQRRYLFLRPSGRARVHSAWLYRYRTAVRVPPNLCTDRDVRRRDDRRPGAPVRTTAE